MEPLQSLRKSWGQVTLHFMVGGSSWFQATLAVQLTHAFSSCFARSWVFCSHLTADCYDIHVVLRLEGLTDGFRAGLDFVGFIVPDGQAFHAPEPSSRAGMPS